MEGNHQGEWYETRMPPYRVGKFEKCEENQEIVKVMCQHTRSEIPPIVHIANGYKLGHTKKILHNSLIIAHSREELCATPPATSGFFRFLTLPLLLPMGDVQKFYLNHPAISTLTEGVGRGFLLYFIPYSVLKRQVKKSVMRRALAFGGFCGVVRLIRYFTQHRKKEKEAYFAAAADKRLNPLVRLIKLLQALVYRFPCQIAGAAGAATGMILDPSLKDSQLFSLWLLVRAARCVIPPVPYGSTVAMCFSAGQVCSKRTISGLLVICYGAGDTDISLVRSFCLLFFFSTSLDFIYLFATTSPHGFQLSSIFGDSWRTR